MAGAIADETIMRLVLQYDQFIKGMRESRDALKQFQDEGKSGGSSMASGLIKQFGQIKQFAGLTSDATGGVAEKMSSVSAKLQEMVKNGQGGSKQAEILSKMFSRLKGDAAGLGGGLNGVIKSLGSSIPGFSQVSNVLTQVSTAFPKLAAAAGPVGVAIMAVAAAYKFIIAPGVEFNSMLEQQSIAFTAMLKSADKATVMISDLKKLSLTTPIGLGESSASAKQLLAYGFAQNEIIDNLKMMKTVSSAVNVSLGDVAYVYGTLRAQGRAYTRDLMQFAMRGIPIYEYLAKTMGITVSEIKKATENGDVGFAEVEAAMKAMTGEGGKFNGMLEASMKTTQGLKTQIKNTWQMFTGEAAAGTSAVFKGLLTYFLSFVKDMQGLAPLFNALFTIISAILVAIAAIFIKIMKVFAFLDRLIQNIVLSIIDIVKWVVMWFDRITGISKLFKSIGDGAKDFGSWLLDTIPVLTTILNTAGKIGEAIKKWWDRAPASGSERDIVSGEFIGRLQRNTEQYQNLVSRFSRYSIVDIVGKQGKELANFAKDTDLPLESVISALATFKTMTKTQYDQLLRNTSTYLKVNRNYWEVYREDFDDLTKDMELKMNTLATGTTVTEALRQVEDTFTSVSGFKSTLDMAKLLGFDAAEVKDSLKGPAQDIADALYVQIEQMKDVVIYKTGEGKTFLDGLIAMWQKYNQITEKEGKDKKTKDLLNDLLDQYIQFRSEWATVEGEFGDTIVELINNRIGGDANIRRNKTMYDRQLEVIKKTYHDKMVEMVMESENPWEDMDIFGPLLTAMEDIDTQALSLNTILKEVTDSLDVNMSGEKSVSLLEEQYNIQLLINGLALQGDALHLANAKALVDMQAKLVQLYKEGDQEALQRWANANMADGSADTSVVKGTAVDAIKDTDVGKLMAGGDPATMFLSALAEMLMSIENVSKVLNFFSTIMDGMKSMIEGPLNTALEPLVLFLTKLGEVLGAIVVPFIELLGDALNLIFTPFNILLELIKRFLVALKPLIKLIMYIQMPFLWLGNVMTELAKALEGILATEEDHQADLEELYDKELATLQNLYEVGALSGAEYEARLAELKARYGMGTESTADSALVTYLVEIFDAISEMGVALDALFVAFKPVLDFLIAIAKPVMTLMLQLLAGFFKDIASIVTAVAGFAKAILTGDWSGAWESFKVMLKAVLGLFLNPFIRIFNWISTLIADVGNWLVYGSNPFTAFTVPEFAAGTGNVASDMYAQIHKGEGIIPSDFMDAIRSGDLSLSGSDGSSGGAINVYITVEGSVATERDLCKTIYDGISTLKRKGGL